MRPISFERASEAIHDAPSPAARSTPARRCTRTPRRSAASSAASRPARTATARCRYRPDVPHRVHDLHRRFAQRRAGLHDAVGDAAGEVVLEEGQALPHHVLVLLPADRAVRPGMIAWCCSRSCSATSSGRAISVTKAIHSNSRPAGRRNRAPARPRPCRRSARGNRTSPPPPARPATQRAHHPEHRPGLAQVMHVETPHAARRHAHVRLPNTSISDSNQRNIMRALLPGASAGRIVGIASRKQVRLRHDHAIGIRIQPMPGHEDDAGE